MQDADREGRIRQRAQEIWEEQGRPEGRHEEHWEQARNEIDADADPADRLAGTLTETIGLAVGIRDDEGAPTSPPKGRQQT